MVASRAARRALQAAQPSPASVEDWTDKLSAADLVDEFLVTSRLDATAGLIWVVWPNLRTAIEKFASHVGGRFPGPNGEPLVCHGIRAAVTAYANRSKAGGPLHMAAGAFLSEVVACGRDLLETQVAVLLDGGNLSPWDPFQMPLGSWVASSEALGVYTRDMPRLSDSEARCAAIYLATMVMPVHDFKLCSESILSGSIAK